MDKSPESPTKAELSKKYNLQAMSAYDFGNIDFDVNLSDVTEKDLEKIKKEEAEKDKLNKKDSKKK
jgi:hypothetical protein